MLGVAAFDIGELKDNSWRRGSESNRRTRLCRPLHDHSATPPGGIAQRDDKPARRYKLRGRASALPRDSGAGKESRTPDLNLGKVALYQLSYSRVGQPQIIAQRIVVSKRATSHVVEIHGLDAHYLVIALVANSLIDGVFTSAECIRVIAFSRLAIEVANEIRT